MGVAFNTMPELWPNTVVSCIQSMRSASQSTAVRRYWKTDSLAFKHLSLSTYCIVVPIEFIIAKY